MSKINLTDLVNLQNETTAVNAINTNNAILETALDNTLSRNGTAPNQMGAAIDMNNNQIFNLPAPSTVNAPARLIDVTSNPTIVVPGTGTSGHTVPFLDGNNTWSGTNTFSAAISVPSGSSFTNAVLTNPTMTTPVLGTPTSGTLTNTTGLPVATGISGLGSGVATFLATPSSANLASTVTGETGTGALVFATSPTLVTPVLGVASGTSLAVTGSVLSTGPTSGIGYNTGSGGSVTQITSKSTAVTLNTICGRVVTAAVALGSNTTVSFTLNNSNISTTDNIFLTITSGVATPGSYQAWVDSTSAGSCRINLRNITGGSLTDPVTVSFAIIKSVNS